MSANDDMHECPNRLAIVTMMFRFDLNTNTRYYKLLISLAQSLQHDMENISFNENDGEYQSPILCISSCICNCIFHCIGQCE